MDNGKLCILPFIHLSTRPDGKSRICSDGDHVHMPQKNNLNDVELDEYWNGPGFAEFRKGMIDGKEHPYCEMCYTVEKGGGKSKREVSNRKYLERYQNIVEFAKRNNGVVEKGPAHWEFRLSKKCNLACLSCSPTNSTLIESQHLKNYDILPEYDKKIVTFSSKQKENPKFIENIWNYIDDIDKIELHGGEPFHDEYCLEILERIGKEWPDNNIELLVHTNMSFMNDRIISILNSFKVINFQMSIDGIEHENSFIRWPAKWKTIEKNMQLTRKINTNPYHTHTVSVTVSPYNCVSLDNLLIWTLENYPEYNIHWFPTIFPRRFNLSIVPLELRKEQADKLLSLKVRCNEVIGNNIDSIVGFLLKTDTVKDDIVIDFVEYNVAMDKIRGTNTLETFPHLESVYDKHEEIISSTTKRRNMI